MQQRIDAQRKAREDKYQDEPRSAWSLGVRYGSEFFGGVFVGSVLGFILDRLAGTTPWGLIIGTFVGFASGTLNVVRTAKKINEETDSES